MEENTKFTAKSIAVDPALKSLTDLYLRCQNPDTPGDVKESVERILDILDKKEKYWMVNTVNDTQNARLIREKTESIPWEQLGKERNTIDCYWSTMISFCGEGQLLQFLIRMQKAKRVLEIGMFTGYGAMAMAECLPEDGIVVTETLDKFVSEGQTFDFIYLEGNNDGYLDYFKKIINNNILTPLGTLAVDNTFGMGRAYTDPNNEVGEFNKAVVADERVEQILLPVFDGLTLIRLKGM